MLPSQSFGLSLYLLCLALLTLLISATSASKGQPNIIFILTDDQDLQLDSLSYMPYLKKHVTEQGTTFGRHYCTVAQCCPSRVSLWTGRAAHNTNVTDVNPPYGRSDRGWFLTSPQLFGSDIITANIHSTLTSVNLGGYPRFVSQGFNSAYLPIWLQELGYATYYVGKLFNAHSIENYDLPRAAGWTGSDFLLNPYTYEYMNATMVRNHGHPVSYEGQYSTDVIADKALDFLEQALYEAEHDGKPFFLTIAPNAPHSNVHMNSKIDGNFTEGSNTQSPPIPAPRHAHLFEDVVVPRAPHFNPENPHGVSWIATLPRQNETNVEFNDHFYRSRLRALQAVDEMIDAVFRKLEKAGVVEETYVFFSTDNGYHIGQHRLQPGKQCAFEEDVHIPFKVKGPGIPRNWSTNMVTTHTDLAPTILKLAGGEVRDDFDGLVIPLLGLNWHREFDGEKSPQYRSGEFLRADAQEWTTEHIGIEAWGVIMSEGDHGSILYPNHTYKALRITGQDYSFLYTIWCSGEHELYDLKQDPFQTENLYVHEHRHTFITLGNEEVTNECQTQCRSNSSPFQQSALFAILSDSAQSCISIAQLLPRLDALIMVLKTCKARSCTHPWEVLHPAVDVRNLRESLREEFDQFYSSQQKVRFDRCEKGYILESEGPRRVRAFEGEEWT